MRPTPRSPPRPLRSTPASPPPGPGPCNPSLDLLSHPHSYKPRPPLSTSNRQGSRTPLLNPAPLPTRASSRADRSTDDQDQVGDEDGDQDGDQDEDATGTPPPTTTTTGTMTPLDRTLESIGMGRYQIHLLVLCGLGWLADNMYLQAVAVILPRVQRDFSISDERIGFLSTSIFAGMMLGAWTWGSYADQHGRVTPFNSTLGLTALFGLAAAFAPTFATLCLALFGLGTAVGGSMPTDGTLFLENIPKTRHYLLTALSVL
ncbi:hypothetical protein JCM10212_001408 [Sporobolomyces blumeae]